MIQYFNDGGPVMYIILVLSIYALSIIIERLYFLYKISFDYKTLVSDIKKMILEQKTEYAIAILKKIPGPFSAITLKILNAIYSKEDILKLKDKINEIGIYEIQKAEGNLKHLAVIGNIAPLLGLLGTVTGIMASLSALSLKSANNPSIVAGGIAQALITTAYGLIVAIIAVLFYNFLNSKYENIISETEYAISDFVEFIEKGLK